MAAMMDSGETGPDDDVGFDPLKALGAYDKLICQGAEGRVFEVQHLSRPTIIKQRFKKKYRHPMLDAKLTKQRLTQEARSLLKARKLGVRCPTLLNVDMEMSCIYLEKVEGRMVKDILYDKSTSAEMITKIMTQVGQAIAMMHDGGLIHGDLTTSNLMINNKGELVVIDFGLSSNSNLYEDKGVDLYVLERAFLSAHSDRQGLFDQVFLGYRKQSTQWSSVFNKFSEVRRRGRKRTMVG